jgi:hypothetical protein
MNLFETLQKFKSIKPDPLYAEQSRRAVLASTQNVPVFSPFRSILQFIETGAAVALAGFFIILISGGFSNSPYIAPVQYSVIDGAGLHAEAQAIDIQIKLANVSYADVASNDGSTAPAGALGSRQLSAAITAATSTGSATQKADTSTINAPTSSAPSIDNALRALEQ